MYISTRGRYAVRALLDIALSETDSPVSLRGISERQNLPISYLEQIFNRLKKVGIVRSVRGVNGGYHLGRPSDEITVGSIIKTMEGPIRLSKCDSPPAARETCIGPDDCAARVLWKRLEGRIDEMLEGVTLSDMVKEAEHITEEEVKTEA
ncbi:MAG: Rrf2 family transcriptional regulator [candidate division Zixibacteria bacterium]|nr:Rrf2 family transcriptional regulator [candidate division Zixibacteria bacterium]